MSVSREDIEMIARFMIRSMPLIGLCMIAGPACNGTGEGGLFETAPTGGERWTIRCFRTNAPDHAAQCQHLASLLRQVQGLKPSAVRVETDNLGSTLYYGEYRKVAAPDGGRLTYPPELERDQALIQQLTPDGRQRPFALAMPEPIDTRSGTEPTQWHVSRSEGTHTLEVAIFYNTPTFGQRKEAAEQYVKLLREDGLPAYYIHEPVKSRVFVGDFLESDKIPTPDGRWQYSARVLELMNRRPAEFRYRTENGHLRKVAGANGQMQPIPAPIVPVPRSAAPLD